VSDFRGMRRGALSRSLARGAVRALLLAHAGSLRLLRTLGPRRRATPPRIDILLTGTFHSDNWAAAHLRPLAASKRCARVRVVSTFPLAPIDKVEVTRPPWLLARAVGAVPARLLAFAWIALRERPHVVGGFHLLVNALLAQVVATLVGARSLYFCVGGPAEVVGGGVGGENRLFSRVGGPDAQAERRLRDAVKSFDLVITMGRGAARYFQEAGVGAGAIQVLAGGIDGRRFRRADGAAECDLIFVGRLAEVKRVDVFLEVVARVTDVMPEVRAVVVGDGPMRRSLESLAARLGLEGRVSFVGSRVLVEEELQRARIFVLTSDSEGLPLSVVEAMMCGLPVVVSDVGDVRDIVEDNVNGYVVPPRAVGAFASRIAGLLREPRRLARFSEAALRAASVHELTRAVERWDAVWEASTAMGVTGSMPNGDRPR